MTERDSIFIDRLQLDALQVGLNAWAQPKAQPVFISLVADCGHLCQAAKQDALTQSVNYGTLCKLVTRFCAQRTFDSGRALVEQLTAVILKTFENMDRISLTIHLPKAILHGTLTLTTVSGRHDQHTSSLIVTSIDDIPMDLIVGLNPHERHQMQMVHVSLRWQNTSLQSLQCCRLVEFVRTEAQTTQFKTVERLAYFIADCCFRFDRNIAEQVHVRVAKPCALAYANGAGACISRERSDFMQFLQSTGVSNTEPMSLYVGIGSNVEHRYQFIELALEKLKEVEGIHIQDTSFMYESKAKYVVDQPPFLNAVLKIETTFEPNALLQVLKNIEIEVGRVPRQRFGPRELDLDILFYEDGRIINQNPQYLEVPHPKAHEREFVLRPLCDLAPELIHPKKQCTMVELLSSLEDEGVTRVIPFKDGRVMSIGQQTHVVAVLNVTPDSFSDGGTFYHEATIQEELPKDLQCRLRGFHEACLKHGISVIDIGGASSRPGAQSVSTEEELRRIAPIIQFLRSLHHALPLSIDTANGNVAEKALILGAQIINDIHQNSVLAKLPNVLADAVILMHTRGLPSTMSSLKHYSKSVLGDVVEELTEKVQRYIHAGYWRWQIVIDPGIGFAKGTAENLALTQTLDAFKENMLSYPVLVGHSRKKFIEVLSKQSLPPQDRDFGTAALAVASVAKGADFIRAHAFAEIAQAVKVADALYRKKK